MQRSSYQKQANVTLLLKLKELPIKVEKTHSPSEMYLNLLVTKAVFLSLKNKFLQEGKGILGFRQNFSILNNILLRFLLMSKTLELIQYISY